MGAVHAKVGWLAQVGDHGGLSADHVSLLRWVTNTAHPRPRRAAGAPSPSWRSALELLAQSREEDLRGLPDEVRVRGRKRGGPIKTRALRCLLLQVEHVLRDLLVALEPGDAVLLGLRGNLVTQLLDPLGRGIQISAHVRDGHVSDSSHRYRYRRTPARHHHRWAEFPIGQQPFR